MEKQKLYSERVRGWGRMYFMDVRTSENGSYYLMLVESKKDKENEGEYETSRIMLFEDDVDAFFAALGRAVEQFHKTKQGVGA